MLYGTVDGLGLGRLILGVSATRDAFCTSAATHGIQRYLYPLLTGIVPGTRMAFGGTTAFLSSRQPAIHQNGCAVHQSKLV